MPRSLLTALAVVIFMPLAAQAQSSALDGEWVGGYRIGEISGYLRFDVVSEGQQLRIVLGTEVFAFEGQLQGDSLIGIVRSGVQEGSFDLARTRSQAQYDPAFFGRYEGAYEIAPNQLIFVRRSDNLSRQAPYGFERTLSCSTFRSSLASA